MFTNKLHSLLLSLLLLSLAACDPIDLSGDDDQETGTSKEPDVVDIEEEPQEEETPEKTPQEEPSDNDGDNSDPDSDPTPAPVDPPAVVVTPVRPIITVNPLSITEGDEGTQTATLNVNLSEATTNTVTINYTTNAIGSATENEDYASDTGALIFEPNTVRQSIPLTILSDTNVEPDENFEVLLTSATNADFRNNASTITISNDDLPPVRPVISAQDLVIQEGNIDEAPQATLTLTLSEPTTETVSLDISTQDSTATVDDNDYLTQTSTITFAPGETEANVTLTIVGDDQFEDDETFDILFNNPIHGDLDRSAATITINNDDAAPIIPTLSIADFTLLEGNSDSTANLPVTLSEPSNQAISIDYTVQPISGGATPDSDFSPAAGSLIFEPGVTERSIPLTILGDSDIENDERFEVAFSNIVNATLTTPLVTVTITNDDQAPVRPMIRPTSTVVDEGNSGVTTTSITLSLTEATTNTVSVDYASTDLSATTADNDYTQLSGTLTFAPGETSKTIEISINGDTAFESNEAFTINYSNPINADLHTSNSAIAITNDDAEPARPTIELTNTSITEGNDGSNAATVTATLSETTTNVVSVDFATTDPDIVNSATANVDYVAISGTLTFEPGTQTQTIELIINGDTEVETTELLQILLSNATNGAIGNALTDIEIVNDDEDPVIPNITATNITVPEGNTGTSIATVTVTLSEATSNAVSIDFTTDNGTATLDDNDYIQKSGTLTFAPYAISQTIVFQVVGDSEPEDNETFQIKFGNPENGVLLTNSITTTITNDDVVTPEISINNISTGEGDIGNKEITVAVTLSKATTIPVTVDFATADLNLPNAANAGTDYVANNGSLTFAPNTDSQEILIKILSDTDIEEDESFEITLSNATSGVITNGSAIVTINNDDLKIAVPSISIDNVATVVEGDDSTRTIDLVVALSETTDNVVTVDYATKTTASADPADADFVVVSGTLEFPANTLSQTISITINGDTKFEADESFNVILSNPNNGTLNNSTAIITILDDDVMPPNITAPNISITEGNSGSKALTISLGLDAASNDIVTVNYSVQDDTASVNDNDYSADNPVGTLRFDARSQTAGFTVTINGDTKIEDNEKFLVILSNPVNAKLETSELEVNIINDDHNEERIGLKERPSNQNCIARNPPIKDSTVDLALEPIAPGISINNAVALVESPIEVNRWYVGTQDGKIFTFKNGDSAAVLIGQIEASKKLETGLLSLAFHPNFANNGYLYASVAEDLTSSDKDRVSKIKRYTLSSDGRELNLNSERTIIAVPRFRNLHAGGHIAFGPDGYLYYGLGDDDQRANTAQNIESLHGGILRIDVNTPTGYLIPKDNPYANSNSCDSGACPEIFAKGLRNPWRWSFDRSTGDLMLGDVGSNKYEEINLIENGQNYGWPYAEGDCTLSDRVCRSELANIPNYVDPILDYPRGSSAAVVGGYVYRGGDIDALSGVYLFGDYVQGRIWALRYDQNGTASQEELLNIGGYLPTFAEGRDGELYIIMIGQDGRTTFQKLVNAKSGGGIDPFPTLLSETGCVDQSNPTQPASGLIPFGVNVPFWSDNAVKDRYIALPDGETITVNAQNDWIFPTGSVLMKNFRLNGKLIETRLMMRHPDGDWAGYSYEWDEQLGDAQLVSSGVTRNIDNQSWYFPGSADCLACHTPSANFALGPNTAQLNGRFNYSEIGGTDGHQLSTFNEIGLFVNKISVDGNTPQLPAIDDLDASLESRARAYLDVNCAGCHNEFNNAGIQAEMDLRYTTSFTNTNTCNVKAVTSLDNLSTLVVPGDSSQSLLYDRMARRDPHGMPPIGSFIVDEAGTKLVSEWINSLTSCD